MSATEQQMQRAREYAANANDEHHPNWAQLCRGGAYDDDREVQIVLAAIIDGDRREAELVAALRALLADTQHSKHNCGDPDCPVDAARAAIAKHEAGK